MSPAERCQSLQVAAEQGLGSGPLPSIAEGPTPLGAPVPQPPVPLASWDEAEAWLWDARTWTDLGCVGYRAARDALSFVAVQMHCLASTPPSPHACILATPSSPCLAPSFNYLFLPPCRAAMLQHDPLAYRPLLLRLSQSGTSVLPMGALRLLAAYARCAAWLGVSLRARRVPACPALPCV